MNLNIFGHLINHFNFLGFVIEDLVMVLKKYNLLFKIVSEHSY